MQFSDHHTGFPLALVDAQQQLFWDHRQSPPAIDSSRFILKVMEIGTWDMVEAMESTFPKTRLIEVLQSASCGALSPRSWNFWCLRLEIDLPYPSRFAAQS